MDVEGIVKYAPTLNRHRHRNLPSREWTSDGINDLRTSTSKNPSNRSRGLTETPYLQFWLNINQSTNCINRFTYSISTRLTNTIQNQTCEFISHMHANPHPSVQAKATFFSLAQAFCRTFWGWSIGLSSLVMHKEL